MSRSDSAHLEELKTARDAIVDALVAGSGSATVRYVIRGREHEKEPSRELLNTIEDQIERYEAKVARNSRGMLRTVQLRRARGTDVS